MIKKLASPIPGHIRVIFELPSCTWADRIYLCGDFNDWRAEDIRLQQDRNGVWRAMLDLPVGRRYEFRYVIDGEWRTDFHADGHTENLFGAQNSVIVAELEEISSNEQRQSSQIRERRISKLGTVGRSHQLTAEGHAKEGHTIRRTATPT
jgi:1,4-alpha-glucan branching enzyme